jgi:hypothetical protein
MSTDEQKPELKKVTVKALRAAGACEEGIALARACGTSRISRPENLHRQSTSPSQKLARTRHRSNHNEPKRIT